MPNEVQPKIFSMDKNKKIYFETSALNYISKGRSFADAIATKGLQNFKGNRWYISSVTIWEILLKQDDSNREKIIHFAQHLFESDLLPSPEEIIVTYLKAGCPICENPYRFVSYTPMAEAWKDICSNKAKTLHFDKDELSKRVQIIRELSKHLHKLIRNQDFNIVNNSDCIITEIGLQSIISNLSFVRQEAELDNEEKSLYKISIFYILTILCAEISLDSETIRKFWKNVGIDSTYERLQYLLSNHEVLVHRGPFLEMALMTYYQTKNKFSRGVLFDSFHAVYLPYIDYLFTTDNHFRKLRQGVEYPNYLKIILMDEVVITSQEREIQLPDSFLST